MNTVPIVLWLNLFASVTQLAANGHFRDPAYTAPHVAGRQTSNVPTKSAIVYNHKSFRAELKHSWLFLGKWAHRNTEQLPVIPFSDVTLVPRFSLLSTVFYSVINTSANLGIGEKLLKAFESKPIFLTEDFWYLSID